MELGDLCSSSRVIIVAGKGGVGKTTVAAALSVAAARAGRTALLVELEGKSGLAELFAHEGPIDSAEVYPGVVALTLAADEALIEYLQAHGLGRVSKKLLSTGALDVVATAVPGMKDILVLGKVKALQKAGAADVIVVDGPATGHAVTFFLSPKGMLDAVRVGPVRTQAIEVTEMLADPERAAIVLVTVPEETPVNELLETANTLAGLELPLGPLIVNGVYRPRQLDGAATATVGLAKVGPAAEAAEFLTRRRQLQASQLERLSAGHDLVEVRLPFLFTADLGPSDLEELADTITAALAATSGSPHTPAP